MHGRTNNRTTLELIKTHVVNGRIIKIGVRAFQVRVLLPPGVWVHVGWVVSNRHRRWQSVTLAGRWGPCRRSPEFAWNDRESK